MLRAGLSVLRAEGGKDDGPPHIWLPDLPAFCLLIMSIAGRRDFSDSMSVGLTGSRKYAFISESNAVSYAPWRISSVAFEVSLLICASTPSGGLAD